MPDYRTPPPLTPGEVSQKAGEITHLAEDATAAISAKAAELTSYGPKVESPLARWLKGLVVALLLLFGGLSTGLQVAQGRRDAQDRQTQAVARCRSELRSFYVDRPGAVLVQIQAAGLEAVSDDEGRSADAAEPNPYSGLTLAELRPLSAEARVEVDGKGDFYATITKLPTDKLLAECQKERTP